MAEGKKCSTLKENYLGLFEIVDVDEPKKGAYSLTRLVFLMHITCYMLWHS